MSMLTATARLATVGPAAWFKGLISAETVKLRATRSTYAMLTGATALAVGIGPLVAKSTASRWPHLTAAERAGFDPMATTFRGFEIAQLIIATLGVLAVSSEYSTGLIRTTFAAAPQRRAVLAAKALVIGAIALLIGTALSFATFFPTQALLDPTGTSLALGHPGVVRALLAMGVYLTAIALTGLGLGTLTRSTAGGVAGLFGLVFLVPGAVSALPAPWNVRIGTWLPGDLAGQLTGLHLQAGALSRPASLIVLLLYPIVFLGLAAIRLHRQDA
ncbi:ABC transporter permease subunit [Streptomyces gilvus]|uniref:ABC transporter permease subunit n=1 Tax=Streptomyces gilvus TaxID=2920937 RepID=UPI001F0D579F|nr:ABC transporter permease subunit [Streptomyces sp. CME 23]MCH5676857.1 ABC transporter permease [Streptomyces sp. CME 23]